MGTTRVVVALAVLVTAIGCSGRQPSPPPDPSVSSPTTSPSPALSDLLPTRPQYVRASKTWQRALTRYFTLSPTDSSLNIAYLDQAEGALSKVERTFREWWSLAEPVAEAAGGRLEREVREYAARSRQWNEVQHRFMAGIRKCIPLAGSQEEALACLRSEGFGRALQKHIRLTLWLRRHAEVISSLNLLALLEGA